MKLIDYARQQGISYRTAWRWYKAGKIQGQQMDTGTILVTESLPVKELPATAKVAVYTRVSSSQNKSNLDNQAERLVAYCRVRGYQVSKVVKEIGSGVNDNRPKFLALLADPSIGRIVIEHKDRGTRFGFRYIETLLRTDGKLRSSIRQRTAQRTCWQISPVSCIRFAPDSTDSGAPNVRRRRLSSNWSRTAMKRRKKHAKKGEPQTITKAVTHIGLEASNAGKLTALDALAEVYLELVQQYVTLFCTTEVPNRFRAPCFLTPLSERWHRVAIQHAAGLAQSWRSNRTNAYQDYLDALAEYQEQKVDGTLEEGTKEPAWCEWNVPTLRQPCIQANGNVIKLEEAADSSFDYWLKLSTLNKGSPLLIPVKLADYHKEQLTDPETGQRRKINSSVTLNKRDEVWWLTLTYDETITVQAEPNAPVIGVDVGIANFLTTSDGKQYGTFNGKLRERQKRDREKRRSKAKLRKCLEKKGVPKDKLPSTSSATGQRLIRHVRQEINRAINACFEEHEGCQFAYEQLSIASMRHKARAMNA